MTDITGVIQEKMTRADIIAVFEEDIKDEVEKIQQQRQKKINTLQKRIEVTGQKLKQAQEIEKKKILSLAKPLLKLVKGSLELTVTFFDNPANNDQNYKTRRPRAYAWIINKGIKIYTDEYERFNVVTRKISNKSHWNENCIATDVSISSEYLTIRNKLVQERNRLNKQVYQLRNQINDLNQHLYELPSKVKKFSARLSKTILEKIPRGQDILKYTNQLTKKAMEAIPEALPDKKDDLSPVVICEKFRNRSPIQARTDMLLHRWLEQHPEWTCNNHITARTRVVNNMNIYDGTPIMPVIDEDEEEND